MAAPQRPSSSMTTSESLSRSNPINQPAATAETHQGTPTQGDPFTIIKQKMTEVREAAMQVESSHELADYLNKLAAAETAMMELQMADTQRQQDRKDKEEMVIGEDEPEPSKPTSADMEAEVRNVRRSEQRTEPDKD